MSRVLVESKNKFKEGLAKRDSDKSTLSKINDADGLPSKDNAGADSDDNDL